MKAEKQIKKYLKSVPLPSQNSVLPDEAFEVKEIARPAKKSSVSRRVVNGIAYAAVALTLTAVIAAAIFIPSVTTNTVTPGDGTDGSKEAVAEKSGSESTPAWSCWLRKTGEETVDGLTYNFDKLDSGILNMTANENGKRYVQVFRFNSDDEIIGNNEFHTDKELSALSFDEKVAAIVPAFWQYNVVSADDTKRLCIIDPLAGYDIPAEAEKYLSEYSAPPVVTEQNEDIYLDGIPASFSTMLALLEAYGIDDADYVGAYEYAPLLGSHPENGTRWLGYFMIYADEDLVKTLLADGRLVARLDPLPKPASQIGYLYTPAEEIKFAEKDPPADDIDSLKSKIAHDYYGFLGDCKLLYPIVEEDGIYVQKYFGTFNGSSIVFMGGDWLAVTEAYRDVTLGEHTITFPDGQICWVYNDGNFRRLEEAYEIGLITDADVEVFGPEVGIAFDGVEKYADQQLVPKHPLDTEDIDKALASDIKYYYREAFRSSCDITTMYIPVYYETEQGDSVVLVCGEDWVHDDVFITQHLCGHDLYFPNGYVPDFYCGGSFMSLKEAYDKGLLTENDFANLEMIFHE